jgi:RNA polymerase sigma-70 factor (ECF subfamily)
VSGVDTTRALHDAQTGTPAALEDLYARVAPRLLSLIRLRLGPSLRSRLESRDILQATFLRSFERFGQFSGTDGRALMAWLARIAENEIRDRADFHHRARRDAAREAPLDRAAAAVPASVHSVLSRMVQDERARRIEDALESLAPPHRDVILLRMYQEMSFAEIASRMGRSEDACRMLLARALAALTLALEEPA